MPTERDKYVWFVQSRRRPEKWTKTWKAGSRGSVTPDPVSRSCVVSQNHYHKTTTAGTFHNVYEVDGDEPELPEHEVQGPEDAHEVGKPCLICQDTIWSRHDLSRHVSRCLLLSHTPSQDQQTTADEVPSTMSLSSVIEFAAPASVVFDAAPAPVIECSAVWKIDQEQTHSYIRKRRKKRYDVLCVWLCCFDFSCFFQNYQTLE